MNPVTGIASDVNVYGTKGLPRFGGHAIDSSKTGAIGEIGTAFDGVLTLMKKCTPPGNENYLFLAAWELESAYNFAVKAAAGKPTI